MRRLLLIVFVSGTFAAFGQSNDIPFDKRLFQDRKTEFQAAVKDIKEGDFHFFDGSNADLNNALYHYLRAQEFNPYSSVLNFKIGVCYLYTNQKFRAIDYLKFAHKVNPNVDENIKFYLAQSYQLHAEFDKAIEFYDQHKDAIRSGDDIQRLFINKKISECLTGKKLKADPVRVWVDNLGDSINSKYPEFSPVISADNRVLFYTARRPDSQGDKVDAQGYHYEDVYYSHRGFGQEWGSAINLGSPVNTKSHDATVGLAPDGKSLIIYRGINSKNGDLYITREGENGVWEEPTSLGDNINTKHHESSACLSFDEKTLYFVSDQPGGFGRHDIYVSEWNEAAQEWGLCENLGETINTEYEEKGVFFHPDGKTLYFSSDGHNNMGGLDVFKTELDPDTRRWSDPVNLGYPISTPDDDIYFVVTGDERYAYYSSYQADGFGEKDLYKITFLGPKKEPMLADADMIGSTPRLLDSPVLVSLFDSKDGDVVVNNNNNNTNNNNNNTPSNAEIRKLENQVRTLSGLVNSFKDEIAALKRQIQLNNNSVNNTVDTVFNNAGITSLEQEVADLKKEIERLNIEVANVFNSGNNNNNSGNNNDADIKRLETEIASLKNEIQQMKNSGTNNSSSSNDADIKKLQTEIANLKIEIERMNNSGTSNTSGNNDADIKRLEKEIADLKKEIDKLNNQVANNSNNNNNNTRPKVFILKGKITDCGTNSGMRANLSVTNERTGEKIKDITTNADGTYTIALIPGEKYGLTATATGYTIDSDSYSSSIICFLSFRPWKTSRCRRS